MKYVHLFETDTQYQEKRNNDYEEPWVSATKANGEVNYNKTEEEKLFGTPFTIESLGSGNITWGLGAKTVQYSKNGGAWETMNSATTISVNTGDEVQFKGTNANYVGNAISTTAQFNVKGNIMSLTNGDEFQTADTVESSGFTALFRACENLVSASNLKLPATTLANSCYSSMFSECISLTTAPELPAATLANNCYSSMFSDCTSLTTAPELPATTLAQGCYSFMFNNCASLTIAPELPATTLTNQCYLRMFQQCTSLSYVKCLATDITANSCTTQWLYHVAPSGTFVKDASMTDWPIDNRFGIPSGWTVQDA